MADTPFEQISRFYDSRVAEFGHHPKACDYGRPESQRKKFQVLSSVCRMEGKSLLDVGCGFADYASFLNKKFGNVAYEGVDLSAKMIEQGLALYPGLNLSVHNILDEPEPAAPTHDIVTANGIFYLLGDVAPTLMRQLVKAMYARAKVAVAFNSLSTWAGPSEPGEFNADPLETLAWCREITPWVVLRHDYMPHDFTIFLYREQLPLDPA